MVQVATVNLQNILSCIMLLKFLKTILRSILKHMCQQHSWTKGLTNGTDPCCSNSLVTERLHPTGLTGYRDCWLQRKAAESATMDRKQAASYEPIPAKK